MDFSLLRSFIAVAEEKSFSTAAKHLFISQQTLSKQIAKIEEEERRLKEQENNKNKPSINNDINMGNVINNKELQKENADRVEELFMEDVVIPREPVKEPSIDNINIPVNNQINKQDEEDDEYFDDFWD